MFSDSLEADRVNYMAVPEPKIGEAGRYTAKIRYGHKGTACTVTRVGEDRIRCDFDEPVRAVTPGQAVVFYRDGLRGGRRDNLMISDCHMHTRFSSDSDAPLEEMAEQALKLGMKRICVTDHYDMEYPGGEFSLDTGLLI